MTGSNGPAREHLHPGDAERLGEAILIAHGASDRDEFATSAIRALETIVEADSNSYNEVDPAAGRFRFVIEPATVDFPGAAEAMAEHAHHHPLIQHIQRTGDGSAHKISDFLTQDQLRATPLYEHVYARLGVAWQLSITMPAVMPRIVAMVSSRNDGTPDFDERDRLVLNLLRPHLAQSYELAREREVLRAALGSATGVLAADGSNVILLGPAPHELTPGAMTLLYRAFGPPGRDDPLPARVARWLVRQRERAVAVQDGSSKTLLQPLVADRGGQRVAMRFVPAATGDCLVLRQVAAAPVAQDLTALGLTAREADVLELVVSGDTNAAVAQALHVSAATVKTHLEHIYRKLGVRGRVEAVSMALDLVSMAPRER